MCILPIGVSSTMRNNFSEHSPQNTKQNTSESYPRRIKKHVLKCVPSAVIIYHTMLNVLKIEWLGKSPCVKFSICENFYNLESGKNQFDKFLGC